MIVLNYFYISKRNNANRLGTLTSYNYKGLVEDYTQSRCYQENYGQYSTGQLRVHFCPGN